MYKVITFCDFCDEFRGIRPDNFSYDGLRVLFDYLDNEETVEGDELDVIAICCDFTESSNEDVLKDYSLDTIEELENNTLVLKVDNDTVIYQNY